MYRPSRFDLERAIELASLVRQAYEQLAAFQAEKGWQPSGGYRILSELTYPVGASRGERSGSQFEPELSSFAKTKRQRERGLPIGFVAERGRTLYVVFRGTVTLAEWVRNLNVRLVSAEPLAAGSVHEGFLQSYRVLSESLLGVLSRADRRASLFIAGHSLGGALATLALAEIAAKSPFRSPWLYTYGSPRVGDRRFAEAFDRLSGSRSLRIANSSDVVVSLPLPVPLFGLLGGYFTHVERPVDFTVQNEDLEKNHNIDTYLTALVSAREGGGLRRLTGRLGRLFRAN